MNAPLPDGTGTILLPFHREAGHLVCLFAQGDTAGKMWGLHLGPTLSEPSAVDHWTFPELTTFPQFSGGVIHQPASLESTSAWPDLPPSTPAEIPPASWVAAEEGCEVWAWRHHHICFGLPHVVPPGLHVPGEDGGWRDQPASESVSQNHHQRLRGVWRGGQGEGACAWTEEGNGLTPASLFCTLWSWVWVQSSDPSSRAFVLLLFPHVYLSHLLLLLVSQEKRSESLPQV